MNGNIFLDQIKGLPNLENGSIYRLNGDFYGRMFLDLSFIVIFRLFQSIWWSNHQFVGNNQTSLWNRRRSSLKRLNGHGKSKPHRRTTSVTYVCFSYIWTKLFPGWSKCHSQLILTDAVRRLVQFRWDDDTNSSLGPEMTQGFLHLCQWNKESVYWVSHDFSLFLISRVSEWLLIFPPARFQFYCMVDAWRYNRSRLRHPFYHFEKNWLVLWIRLHAAEAFF